MPGQVGVPGVRVDQIHLRNGRHHGEIGPEYPERSVCSFGIVLRMRGGALAWLAHALDVDIDELAQLRHELGDMYPSTAIDRGGYSRVSNEMDSRSVSASAIVRIVPQRQRC